MTKALGGLVIIAAGYLVGAVGAGVIVGLTVRAFQLGYQLVT